MKKILILATLSIITTQALAINLQSYKFTDSYRYSVLDDSLLEKFSGKYVLTASLNHIHTPVTITNSNYNSKDGTLLKSMNMLTLGYSYYFSNSFSLGLESQVVRTNTEEDSSYFMGDTILKGKYRFFSNEDYSFSLNSQIFIPTGATNSFSEVERISGALSVVGETHLSKRWHLLASAGYFSGRNNEYDIIDYRDLILAQLGISFDINDKWNINGETYRNFNMSREYGQDEGTYFLTAKNKTTNSLSTYFGVGAAGASELDRDNYTLFAGIKFSEAEEKPAPKQVVAPTPVKKEEPVKVVKRDDEKKLGVLHQVTHIYFANNSADISAEQKKKVDLVLEAYKLNPDINHIVIEGYASKTGTAKRNQVLSEERAKKVKDYLEANGIPAPKLSIVAYGDAALKQYPTEAENRRVEFRIYK